MSSYIYKQKAAVTVLSAVGEESRFISTCSFSKETADEWCRLLSATVAALQALRPVLPTKAELDAEMRKDDEAIGRSISTVEIPQ